MNRKLRITFLATLLLVLMTTGVNAQPVPITEVPSGSRTLIAIGNLVFFTSGDSLFRTDGTAEGTISLEKINTRYYKEFNGDLYIVSWGGRPLEK